MKKVIYKDDSCYYWDGKQVILTITEYRFSDVMRMAPMLRYDLCIEDKETGEVINNFSSAAYDENPEGEPINETRLIHVRKLIKFSNVYTREDLIEQREIHKQEILAAGRKYNAC